MQVFINMEHFLKQIKDNWVILCFIVALIVSWTNINSRLVAAENDIAQLSQVVEQINSINITLEGIKKDISYIKQGFDRHLGE